MKKAIWLGVPLAAMLAWGSKDLYQYKKFWDLGYVSSEDYFDTFQVAETEIIIGFRANPDQVLAVKKFKQGYFLFERDPAGSYMLGRGKNILNTRAVVIKNRSFNLASIRNLSTSNSGLYEPSNFPAAELKNAGWVKDNKGYWRKAQVQVAPVFAKAQVASLNYPVLTQNNTTQWDKFDNLKLPEGILNIGGHGFPLYDNEVLQNGKINLFSKGFTQLFNLEGLPKSAWAPQNAYTFMHLHYSLKLAARNLMKSGYKSSFGDIAAIANLEDSNPNIPYYNVTVEGAKELGKHLFYVNCCATSKGSTVWDIPKNESVIMFDEESMNKYKWAGGEHFEFLGFLNEGMWNASGQKVHIMWYGQPLSWWMMSKGLTGVNQLSEKDIEQSFTDQYINFRNSGWKNSKWFVDANGGYSRVPYLSNVTIYQRENGEFVLGKDGKRKFRTDNFSINIFNKPVTILGAPHEYIRYALKNTNTGEEKHGRAYVDVFADGTASIKKEWKQKGFDWHPNGISRPYPQYWQPETEMWVEGIYRRANGVMSDLLLLSKLEKGQWDASKRNQKYKLYAEQRPKTEPWTFGGNDIVSREVGESQLFYDVLMVLFSGGQAVSTWDDGFPMRNLPVKGKPLYNAEDNWTRYHAKLAAVQAAMKPLEGTNPNDWTYIHFYYPFWGQKHAEIISSGIYYKNKLYVFFLNPTLEDGEVQNVTFTAGTKKENLQLIGHEVYYKTLEVPTGLKPLDFKLEYTTIYGRKVKVNGKVTNKIAEHYE